MESSSSGGSSSRQLGQALLVADESSLEDHLHRDGDHAVSTPPYRVSRHNVSPRSYDCLAADEEVQETPNDGELGFHDSCKERSTSISVVLRKMAAGNTICARGEAWKLTRAVVHAEDAWKGRVSPCPALDHERVRKLFKLRWRYRTLDFLLVHMFLALSLVETPAWCIRDKKCFWSCYPDFTRNYHMEQWISLTVEGIMLTVLVGIALLDMHVYGRDYWIGTKGVPQLSMWFKHANLGIYTTVFFLAIAVDFRAHLLSGYCRVFLYLSMHRRTLLVVTQLRHILGVVFEIWVLIFLNIVLFAWLGMVLFDGTTEGNVVFPDLFEGGWNLFVLFTTTNFPDIMMAALDTERATFIYFYTFVILNVFFLAPLSLAYIFNVFRGGQRGIPRMEEDIRLHSVATAFALLDDRSTGHVSLANMGAFLLEVYNVRGLACREVARLKDLMEEAAVRRPEEPSLDLSDFKDAVSVMDRSLQHAEWITEVQWYFPRLYRSSGFRWLTWLVKIKRVSLWPGFCGTPRVSMLVMDLLNALLLVVSLITLFVATSADVDEAENLVRFDWVQIGVVFGFVITTTLTGVMRGLHNCLQRPTWLFNAAVTSVSVVVVILALGDNGQHWCWRVMRAFRVLHLSLGIAYAPRLGFLVRTLLIMTRRAATPASVLLVWAFFMAVLGTHLFGGKVCVPDLAEGNETCVGTYVASNAYTDTGLMLLNFNDVLTSLMTLFVLFVVNDWYVIVDEFVDVTHSGWARVFFIMNYIMGVAVIINLVVTVVINSFWDEYKNTKMPSSALRQLHDAALASAHHAIPTDDSATDEDCCRQRGVGGGTSRGDMGGGTDSILLDGNGEGGGFGVGGRRGAAATMARGVFVSNGSDVADNPSWGQFGVRQAGGDEEGFFMGGGGGGGGGVVAGEERALGVAALGGGAGGVGGGGARLPLGSMVTTIVILSLRRCRTATRKTWRRNGL